MPANVLLHIHEVTKVSAIQVPHPDTGSPTSVLVTARSSEESMTLGGQPALVRRVLNAMLAALDAADPALGNQPAHEIDYPTQLTPVPVEVAS